MTTLTDQLGFFSHAVLWENGAVIDLGTLPGATVGSATINNTGTIVGHILGGFGDHAAAWTCR